MNLKIVASNKRDGFVGLYGRGDYAVVSLDDDRQIKLGDILSSLAWDDPDGMGKVVRNLTRQEDVRIRIEHWACTKEVAWELLKSFRSANQVFVLGE